MPPLADAPPPAGDWCGSINGLGARSRARDTPAHVLQILVRYFQPTSLLELMYNSSGRRLEAP